MNKNSRFKVVSSKINKSIIKLNWKNVQEYKLDVKNSLQYIKVKKKSGITVQYQIS